ncbi:porin family protein [Fluviicola sp.]|uniref:type IX secretion/gliding motility protein PorT/SprT n=1 Tax=Fluviicola sp. TaxID=1917219 RepID=UPI0028213FD4|nr:porin family protein [Fluviicola sp.]MDR0803016.1 PorT family protein [Fluviicola sp.]
MAVVGILFSTTLFAQPEKTKNYRRFDEHWIHFGFMLGANMANFKAIPAMNAYSSYGITSLETKRQPGGQVGIVTTLKLGHPVVRLRFIPTLSFQERAIQYYSINPDPTKTSDLMQEERVNSTNLDFPLMLQFRTLRINNFAAYVLIGGQYSYDLQSQEKASQNFIDPFVKIKAHDFQGQVGGGLEWFAPFFKFGFEVKLSQSFRSSFIQDNTPVSLPIDRLYNKVLWFSLIFEG